MPRAPPPPLELKITKVLQALGTPDVLRRKRLQKGLDKKHQKQLGEVQIIQAPSLLSQVEQT